jgi:hypothetical protein
MTARLVGLFGTGRSGTSLLVRLLDGMPDTYVHPLEVTFLSVLDELAVGRRVSRNTQANVTIRPLRRLGKPVPTARLLSFYDHQIREIEANYIPNVSAPLTLGPAPGALFAREDRYTAEQFVPAFLGAMANWLAPGHPARLQIFKTIEAPYIGDYAGLFPDMRFVHLMRHPLTFWASAKRTLIGKHRPAWYFACDNLRAMIEYRWVAHAEAALRYRDDPRHRILRFESLVGDPVNEVGALCAWLGADLPPEPARQTTLGGLDFDEMPGNPSEAGVATPREVRDTNAVPLSRSNVVTARERDFILARTGPYLAALGYPPEAPVNDLEGIRCAWRRLDAFEATGVGSPLGLLRAAHSMIVRRRYIDAALDNVARGAMEDPAP